MTASLVFFLWCVAGDAKTDAAPAATAGAPAPVATAKRGADDGAKRVEAARARWDRLPGHERDRLKHAYRELKERVPPAAVEQWKGRVHPERGAQIQRLPPHWRDYLVENARWARREIAKLPEGERRDLMRLPPAERAAAIKERLKPLFQHRIAETRTAARQTFSALELFILRALPPRERAKIIRYAGSDAFGLISPWSWRRYQELGPRKDLIREYLSMPEALAGKPLPQKQGPAPAVPVLDGKVDRAPPTVPPPTTDAGRARNPK